MSASDVGKLGRATRSSGYLALFALLALMMGACGSGTEDDPTGKTWQLEELEGSSLVEATVIDLTITDSEASGTAGCNSYTGPATVSDDGSMTLGPQFAMTFMACVDDDVTDQEQRYVQAMTRVTSYQMAADELLLLDDNEIVVLQYGG